MPQLRIGHPVDCQRSRGALVARTRSGGGCCASCASAKSATDLLLLEQAMARPVPIDPSTLGQQCHIPNSGLATQLITNTPEVLGISKKAHQVTGHQRVAQAQVRCRRIWHEPALVRKSNVEDLEEESRCRLQVMVDSAQRLMLLHTKAQ